MATRMLIIRRAAINSSIEKPFIKRNNLNMDAFPIKNFRVTIAAGFTLVELLISLGVMIILASLAIAPLQEVYMSGKIKTAAEALHNNIQLLRSEAIKNNQNLVLTWQTGSNWCYGLTDKNTCNCHTAGDCTLAGIETVKKADGDGLNLTATGFTTNKVQFDGVRGIADGNGVLTFSAADYSMSISLNQMGRLSRCGNKIKGVGTC